MEFSKSKRAEYSYVRWASHCTSRTVQWTTYALVASTWRFQKHKNPCFHKPASASGFLPLKQDSWVELGPNDRFSLLPNDLVFMVRTESQNVTSSSLDTAWVAQMVADNDPCDETGSVVSKTSSLCFGWECHWIICCHSWYWSTTNNEHCQIRIFCWKLRKGTEIAKLVVVIIIRRKS